MSFEQLRLMEPLLRAIQKKGYAAPTEIQQQAIPHIIDGRDVLGCAQTGTGKTAAFALPIIHRLKTEDMEQARNSDNGQIDDNPGSKNGSRKGGGNRRRRPIRCLILSPTRELAAQIADSFQQYGRGSGLRHTVVYGGVNQGPQCRALRDGVDILVATPGRLLDLLDQGVMSIETISIFVLDEADRMLDMGFIPDIRKLVGMIPDERQTLLFSATMPKEIQHLADNLLENPVTIKIKAQSAAADTVEQSIYFVDRGNKHALLGHLLDNISTGRTLVFSRTKRGADNIAKKLNRARVAAETIHSDKSQAARQRALKNFKQGKTHVLVATDIAARGIDVDGISHVINFDMPGDAETYVHRIGRTGRAGMEGESISFCTREELSELQSIERLLGRSINVAKHDFEPAEPIEAWSTAKPAPKQGRSRYGKSRRGSSQGGSGKKRSGSKYKANGERSASGPHSGGGKGKGGPRNKSKRPGGPKHAVAKKPAATKRRP